MRRRFSYALVGVVLMLFAGFVYAWSVLSAPIAAEFPGWSNAQLSLTFTLCMAFFCLGGMAAGLLAQRIPVRINVRISALLFLVGFFLTSRTQSLSQLYVGYGVLCGTASGFAYNSIMNVMPQWFPDRPGLISGVLLMGFGASSMVIGAAFTAVTGDAAGAWRTTLMAMGVLMAALLFAGSFAFRLPKPGELPAARAAAAAEGPQFTLGQMLRRPSFWLFFLWAVCLSAAGLVVNAQARGIARTVNPDMDAGALSLAVGLISVCNGLGRVLFGALFDRRGRKAAMSLVLASFAVGNGLLLLALRGAPSLLLPGFVLIGLGYGGGPTMSASVTRSFYGRKNYPVNFSVVNLNLLVGSFASTAAGGIFDATGSYTTVFALLFVLIAAALAAMLAIRKP